MYYRNAQCAVVVYDVTKPASFIKARHWVKELHEQAAAGIVIALCANKHDLVEADETQRKVAYAEGQQLAEEEGLLFFETSAKTGFNVKEVFVALGAKVPSPDESVEQAPQQGANKVDLNVQNDSAVNSGCAC